MARRKKEETEAVEGEKPEKKLKRETHNIFDDTIKYLLLGTSSSNVIYLINDLFNRDYDINTAVSFGKTESGMRHGKTFKFFRSDIIINIAGNTFAIEFQTYGDNTIGLRLFEYSFMYAHDTKEIKSYGEVIELVMPEACVVFFESTENTPDHITFRLKDSTGAKSFDYDVRVLKMSEQSLESIEQRKLLLLLPFCLIKYRKELEGEGITAEKRQAILSIFIALSLISLLLSWQAGILLVGSRVAHCRRAQNSYFAPAGGYQICGENWAGGGVSATDSPVNSNTKKPH